MYDLTHSGAIRSQISQGALAWLPTSCLFFHDPVSFIKVTRSAPESGQNGFGVPSPKKLSREKEARLKLLLLSPCLSLPPQMKDNRTQDSKLQCNAQEKEAKRKFCVIYIYIFQSLFSPENLLWSHWTRSQNCVQSLIQPVWDWNCPKFPTRFIPCEFFWFSESNSLQYQRGFLSPGNLCICHNERWNTLGHTAPTWCMRRQYLLLRAFQERHSVYLGRKHPLCTNFGQNSPSL